MRKLAQIRGGLEWELHKNTLEVVMKLQEKLSAMKQESIATKPPEVVATLLEESQKLVQSGIADQVIKVGETLPEFTLSDTNGNIISSKELLAKGPLALSFYRGIWWPYCNVELEALQEIYSDILDLGGSLIAISPQLTKYTKQVVKKHNLTFPVLADKGNEYANELNLVFTLPEKLKELYTSFGTDLTRFNGDDSWKLPMSGRFLVDRNGVIRNIDVHPDHTIRPEPIEIIDFMKSMAS